MAVERAIRIEADGVRLYAVLAATPTADAIWEALPLQGRIEMRGEAVHFGVATRLPLEKAARARLSVGEIAYAPDGPSIGLYFGTTPDSKGDDPEAAGPVNVLGRITGDARRLARARPGGTIRMTRLEG